MQVNPQALGKHDALNNTMTISKCLFEVRRSTPRRLANTMPWTTPWPTVELGNRTRCH